MIKQSNSSEMQTKNLIDVRCPGCARKLMEWIPTAHTFIRLKCRHCKQYVELGVRSVVQETGEVDISRILQ